MTSSKNDNFCSLYIFTDDKSRSVVCLISFLFLVTVVSTSVQMNEIVDVLDIRGGYSSSSFKRIINTFV